MLFGGWEPGASICFWGIFLISEQKFTLSDVSF